MDLAFKQHDLVHILQSYRQVKQVSYERTLMLYRAMQHESHNKFIIWYTLWMTHDHYGKDYYVVVTWLDTTLSVQSSWASTSKYVPKQMKYNDLFNCSRITYISTTQILTNLKAGLEKVQSQRSDCTDTAPVYQQAMAWLDAGTHINQLLHLGKCR